MNLDDMLQECALYTDTLEELYKTGSDYVGDAGILAKKFKTGINYAKGKIVREKFTPTYSEIVTLDENSKIDINNLSRVFLNVVGIRQNNHELHWERASTWHISVPLESGDIEIEYGYMPSDLVDLLDELDLPKGVIDEKILCYYAAYQYHLIEGSNKDLDKSNYYLSLFNDGLQNISCDIGNFGSIKNVYRW